MKERNIGAGFDAVLSAAQAGGGWAIERLWSTLAPAVAGYLRTQGVPDADDVTSEVFLGVFRGLPRFSGNEAAFRSWVFTIAHRRLQDTRRQAARRPVPTSLETTNEPAFATAAAAEDQALQRVATERVTRLCGQLAPDQRDVLLLRLVAGMTIDEIADVTGKSRGATKALQRRGIVALEKILSAEAVPL